MWSKTKKAIESRMADSVRDRIKFGSTTYRESHDGAEGRGWIAIDGKEILSMDSLIFDDLLRWRSRPVTGRSEEEVEKELHEKNLFSKSYWNDSLSDYLTLSIDRILRSENPIIRAMGMLDARTGKRRLEKMNVSHEHDLVKRLYHLRCDAEKITGVGRSQRSVDLTSRLDAHWRRRPTRNVYEERKTAVTRLSQTKRLRNIRGLIQHIHNGTVSEDELGSGIPKEISEGFTHASDPDNLLHTLLFLESNSKLLRTVRHARGVVALNRNSSQWLRPLEAWTPKSHNADRQFSSLSRHLWAAYDVPLFMDKAWLEGNGLHQSWFRHIGAGKNIRTAENLPLPLTKKMAHHFLQAPEYYSIKAAFRWGQVHASGGDGRLADALLETRIIDDFRNNDFCLSVIRFFTRNPMLDPLHINPIIDYIWNQKYENRIVFVDRGVAEEIGPEQPNFSMRGRTVFPLLRAVEAWHRRLGREQRSGNLQWKRSGIEEFHFVEGTKSSRNMKIWKIRELLSSQELVAEGRQMRHCVASYDRSCCSGRCSIWTMDVQTEEGMEKRLTIEVLNREKRIRQIRGLRNRLPTQNEKAIMKRWALKAGLEAN